MPMSFCYELGRLVRIMVNDAEIFYPHVRTTMQDIYTHFLPLQKFKSDQSLQEIQVVEDSTRA